MGGLQRTALVLTIIGAINWGLVGLFQFDLVASLFGGMDTVLSRIVYSLVGLAGLVNLGLLFVDEDEKK
ncbi:MAG: DUF378 domain-containing protein [Bacilli bacterium]|nr:DUF378 domain-containing protein [Bacilli bacterium]